MKDLVARWMTDGWDELRVLGSFATAAYVTSGAVGSLAAAILWLLQHRPTRTQS